MASGAERAEDLARRGFPDLDVEGAPDAFFTAASLSGQPIPPRHWLAEGMIPGGTVTMLGGDGGTGKSLLALQLAVAVASGRQWLGRSVSAGRVVYVSAEDDRDELHRRLASIADAAGLGLDDLDQLTIRSLAGEDAVLAAPNPATKMMARTPLFTNVGKRIADEAPALAVFDTLADLFGGEENNRAQVRQFVGMLRGLAIKNDCAVLLLAHPSLTGMSSGSGLSGSTAWNASVRSRLYLERIVEDGYEANPDARRLVTKKSNYGRAGGEIGLTWQVGVFVADAPEIGLNRMAASSKAQRVFLALLRQFTAQGRYVSASPGPTYAPAIFADDPGAEGVTKRALKVAMNELFRAEKIVTAKHGSGNKARSHIAEAEAAEP